MVKQKKAPVLRPVHILKIWIAIRIKFISTGQNVPDDIKTPSKEELCSLILGDETIC